ncbi:hypothetical protein NEOKW01_1076 [Nematocida sp. AWRm80]|nr:hypothetical protein NEOKW01_1076 [Nematocida sp. AWRm80]
MRRKECMYYSSGKCRYGRGCSFAHILTSSLLDPPSWILGGYIDKKTNLTQDTYSCDEVRALCYSALKEGPESLIRFVQIYNDALIKRHNTLVTEINRQASDANTLQGPDKTLVDIRDTNNYSKITTPIDIQSIIQEINANNGQIPAHYFQRPLIHSIYKRGVPVQNASYNQRQNSFYSHQNASQTNAFASYHSSYNTNHQNNPQGSYTLNTSNPNTLNTPNGYTQQYTTTNPNNHFTTQSSNHPTQIPSHLENKSRAQINSGTGSIPRAQNIPGHPVPEKYTVGTIPKNPPNN